MPYRIALIYIHLAAVLFGMTGVLGAVIQASAGTITFGRAAFAVLALTAFAAARRCSLRANIDWRRAMGLLACGAVLAAHWVTFFISVKIGGIAVATLGFASFPAFITLLEARFYRERIQQREALLVTLVTVGLVLVIPSFDFNDDGLVGLAWGIASGFAFAVLAVANRSVARGLDPIQVACWQNLAVAILTAPWAWSSLPLLGGSDWFWLAVLGILCTGLSHYLFVASLSRLSAGTAGMVIALEPVYAIAAAWLLFAQQPSARMLAGAACIIAASVAAARRRPG